MAEFKSFKDMGISLGVKEKKARELPPRKCFKCGGEMKQIEGTNVFVCTGKFKNGKACNNRVTSRMSI